MSETRTVYCENCGTASPGDAYYCSGCGRDLSRKPSKRGRAVGIAFLLNEAATPRVEALIGAGGAAALTTSYEAELFELTGQQWPPEPAREPERARQPEPEPVPAQQPPAPPRPRRRPRDWSWLAEHQANLFLFAGAFLVVVAALIYVAYSGQAISGALKMSLLVLYTLAFLAGVVCLRMPRVRVAGEVFFGVGALLVPLNFVAAYNIFSEEELSRDAMWLAGSLTTAIFYTAVSSTGLGKHYAYSAGVAVLSAAAASVAVADISIAWAPAVFVAIALALSLADIAAPSGARDRITAAWVREARIVAPVATVVALAMTPLVAAADILDASRWFLLPSAVFVLAFYAIETAVRGDRSAVFAAVGALSLVAASFVYGMDLAVEHYALAFIGAGATAYALALWPMRELRVDAAGEMRAEASLLARVIVAAGVGVAILSALIASNPEYTYQQQTAWSLLVAFIAGAAFFAWCALILTDTAERRLAALAFSSATVGAATAVVYGAGWSGEYYAYAFSGSALALMALSLPAIASLVPADLTTQAVRVAHVSAATAGAVIIGAVLVAAGDPSYELEARWTLAALFGLLVVFYAIAVVARRGEFEAERSLSFATMLAALFGITFGAVYALDVSAEYYAFAAIVPAVALGFAAHLRHPRLVAMLPEDYLALQLNAGRVATVAGVGVAVVAAGVAANPDLMYQPDARAFLPVALALAAAFFAIDTAAQPRAVTAFAGLTCAVGVATGVVYALDLSAEYYAFALIVPAVALGAAAHLGIARLQAMLPDHRSLLVIAGRIATVSGIGVAIGMVAAAASPELTYEPQSRVFFPVALTLAAAFFALDASTVRHYATSTAVMVCLLGAALGVAYATDTTAEWYGVTLTATGLLFGFGRRVWTPDWLDERASEHAAILVVTAAWLPFEGVYREFPRIAAGIHFAAAAFYAVSAFGERRMLPNASRSENVPSRPLPIAPAWLYAAGLALSVGYVHLLRALPSTAEEPTASELVFPMLGLSFAVLAVGAAVRRWRADFTPHLYVMALMLDLVAISAASEPRDLALVLTLSVAASLAVAVWERAPLLALPAVAFGFGAVAAWQRSQDWPLYAIPMAYSAIAVAAYGAGFALRHADRRWSDALRAGGGLYALVAPAAGFVMLANGTTDGLFQGGAFETSTMYQWSTLAVGLVGALALVESTLARRGWAVVDGSAVLLVALLLEFGHLQIHEVQAYTAVIGVYVLLLGALGLWRFRLIPELSETAPYVEALGAAIVLVPALIRSLNGGWPELTIVLAEAVTFFTLGIALKRRGLVVTATTAFVLIAARVLFDAVQALPNWIIVLIAGMGLLAVGFGILLGRERWSRWQDAVLAWWEELNAAEPGGGAPRGLHGQQH